MYGGRNLSKQIPDKDYIYTGLLGNSYFPTTSQNRDEIPPVFSTEDFTPKIADEMLGRHKQEDRKKGYDQIGFRLSRFNNVTRLMHIPHPLPYARLCQCINKYWERLKHICENPNSLLKPAKHDDKSLFRSTYNEVNDNVKIDFRVLAFESQNLSDVISKVDLTRGKFYRANADISLFFPSIYTHSIPWALVGHSEAKSKQGYGTIWYNQLDRYQQQIKRKETQGVPIGPATSAIMSELILFEIDNVLRNKNFTFIRLVDDYECYCETEEEGRKFIMHIEEELRKYHLNLNAKKVSIEKLPHGFQTEWVIELRNRLPSRDYILKPKKIADILDYAINLQNQNPDGNVLKYATRALTQKIDENNAYVFLKYLISIVFYNPTVLPILCKVAEKHHEVISDIDFEPILRQFLKFQCSDTICWGLYFMGISGNEISDELANAVIETKDCMSMGMLIALNQHKDKVINFLNHTIDPESEYDCDQYWILLHELVPACPKFNYYRGVSGLKFLIEKNVHFIQPINEAT